MPNIRNLQLLKRFTDLFKLKTNDTLSSEAGRMLVPVVSLSIYPGDIQVNSANRATTGSLTPLTASTSKKTFVTGVLLAYMHDVVADSTAITTTLVARGKGTSVLIQLPKLSLTADTKSQFVSLNPPIELEKGSDVIATHTFTVGAGTIASSVYFYEEED